MPGFVLTLDAGGLKELERAQLDFLRKTVARVERNAKLLCPVDTGRLRSSITSEVDERTGVGMVGSDVRYASYVELGTRFMAAQPFLGRPCPPRQGILTHRGS